MDPADEHDAPGPVTGLAEALTGHPWKVVGVSLLVAALAAGLAWGRLGIETSRSALLGEKHDFNRRFTELMEDFGDVDAMVVVVSAPSRGEAIAFADEVAAQVRADETHFASVFYRIPVESFRGRALLFLPREDVARLRDRLEASGDVLPAMVAGGLTGLLEAAADEVRAAVRGDDVVRVDRDDLGLSFLLRLAEGARLALARGEAYREPPWQGWVPAEAREEDEYVWTGDGRLVVLVHRRLGVVGPAGDEPAQVGALRAILADLEAAHPEVATGLTGGPVLEVDEMATFARDAKLATLFSLASVTLLSIVSFRRLLAPLLVTAALCVGVVATLGFAAVWPGQLNLISVAFCALLVGLGVDYGIHLISRYDEERSVGLSGAPALAAALGHTGRAVAAGAFTTALAFGATLFTDIQGVREFGVVCGVGVVLCLAANLFLLPALVALADRSAFGRPRRPRGGWAVSRLAGALDRVVDRRAGVLVAVCLAAAAASLVAAFARDAGGRPGLRYDSNLLSLQAGGLESVRLAQEVLADDVVAGMFAAIVVEDLERLAAVEAEVERLETVARTQSILDVLPARQEAKLADLAAMGAILEAVPTGAGGPNGGPEPRERLLRLTAALEALVSALEEAATGALATGRTEEVNTALLLQEQLEAVARAAAPHAPGVAERAARLAAWEATLAEDLERALDRLREECRATRVAPADLPAEVRARFVGRDGRYLLRVFPRDNLWEADDLAAFLAEVRAAVPDVGGVPVQLHESDQLMQRGYTRAAGIAFAFIVFFLVVHFRGAYLPAVAATTLLVGLTWALGALALLGIDLNPANLIALPLTVGIGIDYAIHVVHRHREAWRVPSVVGTPGVIATSTGRAVLFSTLTTTAGFGALALLSHHRGVASIGATCCVGVLASFGAAFVFCPAVLRLGAGPAPPADLRARPGPKTDRGGGYVR